MFKTPDEPPKKSESLHFKNLQIEKAIILKNWIIHLKISEKSHDFAKQVQISKIISHLKPFTSQDLWQLHDFTMHKFQANFIWRKPYFISLYKQRARKHPGVSVTP